MAVATIRRGIEAAGYWRRYLGNDCQSEWAARARRSLKFCDSDAQESEDRGHS
jgi:hypothetical protein